MGLGAVAAVSAYAYFSYPTVIDTGYQPVQPVPYSHKLHAGQLGLDCYYCHSTVYKAAFAAVPATQTCMNCHAKVKDTSPRLELVRAELRQRAKRFRGCTFTAFPTTSILITKCTSPPG